MFAADTRAVSFDDMKKWKKIRRANLPMSMPLFTTIVLKMAMDFYQLGRLARVEIWAFIVLLWVLWIADGFYSEWIDL